MAGVQRSQKDSDDIARGISLVQNIDILSYVLMFCSLRIKHL